VRQNNSTPLSAFDACSRHPSLRYHPSPERPRERGVGGQFKDEGDVQRSHSAFDAPATPVAWSSARIACGLVDGQARVLFRLPLQPLLVESGRVKEAEDG
jgi:hypothetical protein